MNAAATRALFFSLASEDMCNWIDSMLEASIGSGARAESSTNGAEANEAGLGNEQAAVEDDPGRAEAQHIGDSISDGITHDEMPEELAMHIGLHSPSQCDGTEEMIEERTVEQEVNPRGE